MNGFAASSDKQIRVLITNTNMVSRTGSELYVRDLALALLKRNYAPVVYSPRLGDLAEEIRLATIPVVDNLNALGAVPDLIHGQHHLEAMTALVHFPTVPAIYFCHGWIPWEETPPRHPRILKYVAVSEVTKERLISEHGVPPSQVTIIANFVDLERFVSRPRLPDIPKKALVFSNQATPNFVEIVQEACAYFNISTDVVGLNNGNPTTKPESILGNYDIVFARGRAALEALAIGTAVICCDVEGVGEMITTSNVERYRRHNLGIRVLNRPISARILGEELERYNAEDAMTVSRIIRSSASLSAAVDEITNMYAAVLTSWRAADRAKTNDENAAVSAYLSWMSRSVPHQLEQEIHQLRQQSESLIGERNLLLEQVRILSERPMQFRTLIYERPIRFIRSIYHVTVPLTVRLFLRNLRKEVIEI
jgi:glycosyltransferase involved in cell wall biosynthesis